MKCFIFISVLATVVACHQTPSNKTIVLPAAKSNSFRLYSKDVSDSFQISVSVPGDYDAKKSVKYPVVYMLDANFHFDVLSVIFDKYSSVGLTPPVILVGIGYKDLSTMDSLRDRDDTYPVAIPEYEMVNSGGANKFLAFINHDLIPKIDKEYSTDTTQRMLMGHSLAGYFVTYALLQDLLGKSNSFQTYIAASPSIHYNHYWLLDQFRDATKHEVNKKRNLYITYGGLEDQEDADVADIIKVNDLSVKLSTLFSPKQINQMNFKSEIFSNLDHMNMPIPSFIKGLQFVSGSNNQ